MKEFDFQAWRTAQAEKQYGGYDGHPDSQDIRVSITKREIGRIRIESFLLGMATEAPVAELRGEIAALKKVKKMFFTGSSGCRAVSVDIIEAEEKLARLLEKGDANA